MEIAYNSLLSSLETSHEIIQNQQAIITKQQNKISLITEQYESLRHQIICMQRHRFGKRSEQLGVMQPDLFGVDKELKEKPVEKEQISYTRKKPQRNGHHVIPKNLLRHRIEYKLPEEEQLCPCGCGQRLRKIGEEILEQLEIVPKQAYVLQHVRFKYAGCSKSNQVIVADMPYQPIPKSAAGPGLLADVLVKKYDDHLPLYRQSEIFERHEINLSRSTLCGWVGKCADLLEPLVKLMQPRLLSSPKIHTDDTTVPVLDPGAGKTKTGRLWVYHSDDRGVDPPDRQGKWSQKFLQGYKGYLQADAYSGYDKLYEKNATGEQAIIEVACMAHVRRKFFEVAKNSKRTCSAHNALGFIQKLYRIESEAKKLTNKDRCELRTTKAKPILEKFKQWLDERMTMVLPKSPLGGAIQYALNQWQALTRYLEDGCLDIDNNKAERLIKPLVIGRKNWTFAGSDAGGKHAAIIYSLIETCKLNNINPYTYLKDVLTRLPNHLVTELDALLPYNWQPLVSNNSQLKQIIH